MKKHWTLKLMLLSVLLVTAVAFAQESDKKESDKKKAAPASPEAQKTAPAASVDVKTYKIGPGDLLAISVWKEPELSQKVPVRPDGMITLPLVGDLKASGMTPLELQSIIEEKLKAFISSPAVTVIVEEVRSHVFNVMGQVLRPGTYGLAGRTTVLDGLSQAGGFRDFAKTKKIYVMRTMPDGTVKRLPFNYNEVIKGQNVEQNVELESHDTIIVP
ncbi:MAG TPA: polysaccharide biosynthesis/export family protein [Terriglobales bacterium]|nr:polysaccharide biosynthesis/export family protein [Terriglobales bacterium]